MTERRGLSVVVPVFNSAATLEPLVERITAVLVELGRPYEVVLVDDGSSDGSWDQIVAISAGQPAVRSIRLMRNFGQHNALLAAIRSARYPVTVTIDDDLQHPPEAIPALLAELDRGFDLVYGKPIAAQHGSWRNITSRVTKFALSTASNARIARDVSAFRAFRTDLRDAFADFRAPFVSVDVLLSWGAGKVSAVPVPHEPRAVGRSNYTFSRLLRHTFNMLTGFSTWPLRVASLVGFTFTLFGIAVLAYVLIVYLIHGRSVPGFAFLASIITIFAGAQLFALGVIGEYLARMHFRLLDQPPYAIRERRNFDSTDD